MRISDLSSDVCSSDLLDLDSDRLVIGNPFLVDSELLNLDARYEWYFNQGEYFSAGLFYKDIDKPVEMVLNGRSGSSWQQSFINAPSALVYGLELDFRKYFDSPLAWTGDSRLLAGTTSNWSDSDVTVEDGEGAHPLDAQGRRP